MAEFSSNSAPLSELTRSHLRQLRGALLNLHKSILEVERVSYEREHGRLVPGELLHLLMHDPFFGWFRPVSEVVVQIDEILDSKEPVTERSAENLLREVRSLLRPAEEGEEFAVRYREALQEDPAIILAHAELNRLLHPSQSG